MSIEHGPFTEPSQDRTPRDSCPWNAKKVRSWARDGEDFPKGGWGGGPGPRRDHDVSPEIESSGGKSVYLQPKERH